MNFIKTILSHEKYYFIPNQSFRNKKNKGNFIIKIHYKLYLLLK